jgi:hypothetical protein
LAADQILELCGANHLLDQLIPHANQHEIHRQLGTTPPAARDLALTEKLSVLRLAPACPSWPYVWNQRTQVRVGDDGKVRVNDQRHSIAAPPRSTVLRCLRPDGDLFYLHRAQTPRPNLSFCSTAQSSDTPSTFDRIGLSSFDRTQNSTFESYTTGPDPCVDRLGRFV